MPRISLTIAVVLFLLATFSTPSLHAGAPLEVGKMKAALQTANPEENGFIEKVSDLVVQDKLPRRQERSLVQRLSCLLKNYLTSSTWEKP